jgi:CubicO group peptidase (beta-lactamase class C family)
MRSIGLSVLFTVMVCICSAQPADLIRLNRTQQQQAGTIYFSDKTDAAMPLSTYTLTNISNLFITAHFDNSLTNYLHRLAPSQPIDSLRKKGNFRFSLLVDGKPVYSSDLLPGAPPDRIRDSALILRVPLIDNSKDYSLWSEYFWNRFLRNGGDSILTEGAHTLRMEIRPYLQLEQLVTGELMASGEIQIQVLRRPVINPDTIHLSKVTPYPGFPVSDESFDTRKIRELKGQIGAGIFKRIRGIVVIKNGRILIEEYFNGASRSSLHNPRSVGKSFASTAMGIAIQEGHIAGVKEPLRNFYTVEEAKGNITIEQLLTMSSPFDGNDSDSESPGNEEKMYPEKNWVNFALAVPLKPTQPPGGWRYFTAGVVLLGDILDRRVPGKLKEYADKKLFEPLGIRNYQWQYTPQDVPNTAGGIQLCALDFAKYGQLYKNDGLWNGKRILPAAWVQQSFTRHKKIPGRTEEYYGYLFWNKSFPAGDKSYEAYYCAGNGGNYILVFKDQPLVIVITASAYGQPYAHPQVAKMLSEYILPAVIPVEN